jgi:hypothetical protein
MNGSRRRYFGKEANGLEQSTAMAVSQAEEPNQQEEDSEEKQDLVWQFREG